MPRRAIVSALLATAVSACGSVVDLPGDKAIIDLAGLSDGIAVTLSGDLGTVVVALAAPFPQATEDDLRETLYESVELVVSSPRTGVTVSLASGTLVAGTPSAAGEVSWAMSESRDTVTLTFFNATVEGQALDRGFPYDAMLAIGENPFVEGVPATSFSVLVQ